MKILFVFDRLPFPPRDGSTIPVFNFLRRLAKNHEVSLLYVKDKNISYEEIRNKENRSFVKNLYIVESKRASVSIRIKDELLLKEPYFLGWSINVPSLIEILKKNEFDVIWAGSINVFKTIEEIRNYYKNGPIYVLGLSDSNTAVLRTSGKLFLMEKQGIKTRSAYLIRFIRSYLVSKMEDRILEKYEIILVQTNSDLKWLRKISNGRLSSKTMVMPNGVNEDLFSLPITIEKNGILFLGILNNGYGKSLEWLLDNVWPKIKMQTQKKLFVIGRGASKRLRARMGDDEYICYNEFVPNICDIFKSREVMLAPIFKGYGLINKVVESMAAGVPVIGTKDGFNGIPDFIPNQHGIIAQNPDEFVNQTINLINDPNFKINIAYSAKKLIQKHFLWDDRINSLLRRIESEKIKGC